MMKPIPPDFTYAPVMDSKSTATAPKPIRSEFRIGLYKDETHDQDGQHTAKTVGCSWACYLPGPSSMTCSTNAFSYSYEKFRGCQSKCLGIFQILIGLLCIAANIAWLVMGASYQNTGQGIWGGILITIAGSFALAAGKRKSKCTIAGLTIWTVIAAGAAATIIALTAIEIADMVSEHGYEVYKIKECEKFVRTYTTTTTTTTTQRPSYIDNPYYPGWSGRNDYGQRYDYDLQRYNECQSTLNNYVVDIAYYEKLALSIALIVLAVIALFLFLWSFIISVKPFSCNCKRNQESIESDLKYNLLAKEQMVVTTKSGEPPKYTDDSMIYTIDTPAYQSANYGPIDQPDVAEFQIGGKSVEKQTLTDRA
jgi:hypothetical protein